MSDVRPAIESNTKASSAIRPAIRHNRLRPAPPGASSPRCCSSRHSSSLTLHLTLSACSAVRSSHADIPSARPLVPPQQLHSSVGFSIDPNPIFDVLPTVSTTFQIVSSDSTPPPSGRSSNGHAHRQCTAFARPSAPPPPRSRSVRQLVALSAAVVPITGSQLQFVSVR